MNTHHLSRLLITSSLALPILLPATTEAATSTNLCISSGGTVRISATCSTDETAVAIAGPTGPKGATGATGAKGATGAAGVAGAKGATGATGVAGAKGATGTAGVVGAKGATGAVGAKGATGATGATGVKGATGAAGTSGNACASVATGLEQIKGYYSFQLSGVNYNYGYYDNNGNFVAVNGQCPTNENCSNVAEVEGTYGVIYFNGTGTATFESLTKVNNTGGGGGPTTGSTMPYAVTSTAYQFLLGTTSNGAYVNIGNFICGVAQTALIQTIDTNPEFGSAILQ